MGHLTPNHSNSVGLTPEKPIKVEFSSLNYNLETMNCNTFSRFLNQYLDPSEKEEALEALREVIFQTAQTANNIGRI